MKKIVYLLGAGATQAEIDRVGFFDVVTGSGVNEYFSSLVKFGKGHYSRFINKFILSPSQDIELMMSLFENSSIGGNSPSAIKLYREIRRLYRIYIVSHTNRRGVKPVLLSVLLQLNRHYGRYLGSEGEKIIAVLTTNYDSLADNAFKNVYGSVNYGYSSITSLDYRLDNDVPVLLKLHGAFNWKIKDLRITVSKSFERQREGYKHHGWIPPSIDKKPRKNIIFNKIWKRAYQILMGCDILRVIGSSLRNEDWELISLIFHSQVNNRRPFEIEFIIPKEEVTGEKTGNPNSIKKRLSFLSRLKPADYPFAEEEEEITNPNIFLYWVIEKVKEIEREKISLSNDKFIKLLL